MSKPVVESIVKVVLGLVAVVSLVLGAPEMVVSAGIALLVVGLVELPFRT